MNLLKTHRLQFWFVLSLVFVLFATSNTLAKEEEKKKTSKNNKKKKPTFNAHANTAGQVKTCRNFKCSKDGMTPVPKLHFEFTSEGCSELSAGMAVFLMEKSIRDESCCDQWQACYQICGSSKSVCDNTFQTCETTKCNGNLECEKMAAMSHTMISTAGCDRFDEFQLDACDCLPEGTQAEERRKLAIRKFYQKVDPDNAQEKAQELAPKAAATAAKMSNLFRKLLSKYPSVIQRVKDGVKQEL